MGGAHLPLIVPPSCVLAQDRTAYDNPPMDNLIASQLTAEFDLGLPLDVTRISQGNCPAYRLRTAHGTFFIKSADGNGPDWPDLYHLVEQTLNSHGQRQARMLPTSCGTFRSANGYLTFEWLPGDAVSVPNPQQFANHIEHLARYNRALRHVPLTVERISQLTQPADVWSKAASLDYMLEQFRLDSHALGLSDPVASLVEHALLLLRRWRPIIQGLPRQLIHSDIGPGNILFEDDQVISIIDFTPGYEFHLYALCMSLFWHCIFDQPDAVAQPRIATAAMLYVRHHNTKCDERRCFFPLLLRTAAYRVFARLLARAEAGLDHEAHPFSAGSTERMASCIERILTWEGFLTDCL
jgi:hypothetical protein